MAGGIPEFACKNTPDFVRCLFICRDIKEVNCIAGWGMEIFWNISWIAILRRSRERTTCFRRKAIIRETQEKYQNLYGVKKSYLLINGTSGGLIAGILASVEPGGLADPGEKLP